MVNKVILIGNVGMDPEIRTLEGGTKMARLRVATTERIYNRQTQETREHTEWHTVMLWRGLADVADRYVRKGSQVYIEGSIRTREWTDKDNNKRYSTEIVANDMRLLGRRAENAGMPMDIFEVDEVTDYEYDLGEWIEDMMLSYQRMGKHEKCIRFCREVLETFSWKNASPAMFKRCIGECLLALGKTEEGDQWYEDWLGSEWDPDAAIAGTFYWMARRNYGKAEQILDRILEESEGTADYDGFYRSAAVFYRQMGKEKKAEAFDRMEEEYAERLKKMENDFEDWKLPFFSEDDLRDSRSTLGNVEGEKGRQQSVVKPKKIYPNDPCPCGSGKKYKKCCGR